MQKWNKPTIIHDQEDWLAVSKPSGLASIHERDEEATSLHQLLEKDYQQKLFVVHRLDKDTSGLMLFAKNETAHQTLSLLFQERNIEKTYLGIVAGSPYQSEGTIDAPIAQASNGLHVMCVHPKRGKASQTKFKIVQRFGLMSLMEFHPTTGRTHQIRVHCQHIGHPLLCDPLYGNAQPIFLSSIKRKNFNQQKSTEEQPILQRLALHSTSLRFRYNHQDIHLQAPLFKDMKAFIQQLEKYP